MYAASGIVTVVVPGEGFTATGFSLIVGGGGGGGGMTVFKAMVLTTAFPVIPVKEILTTPFTACTFGIVIVV